MADTNTAPAQEPSTSDMLAKLESSPWDEVEGTDDGDVTAAEKVAAAQSADDGIDEPDEPTDNRERSRLGRQLKAERDARAALEARLAELEGRVGKQPAPAPQPQAGNQGWSLDRYVGMPPVPEVPEYTTTPADIERYNSIKSTYLSQVDRAYQHNYMVKVRQLGRENPDLHNEIVDTMVKKFNQRLTGNPVHDADTNYAKAEAALVKEKHKAGVPLRAEKAKGTAPNAGTSAAPGKGAAVKLDREAREFLESPGVKKMFKDEDLSALFGGR